MPKPSFATHWRHQLAPAGTKFYLPLTSGAGAPRELVNGQSGAITGAPTWGAGPYGRQMGGFGTSNYVSWAPPAGGQILHAAYPCWIAILASNATSVTDGMALCESNTGVAAQYCGLRYNPGFTGQLAYYSRDNAGNLINVLSGSQAAVSDGRPHVWMGLSLRNNDHRVYLDGVQVGSSTSTVGTSTFNVASLGTLLRSSAILGFAGQVIWGAIGNGAHPDPQWLASNLLGGVFPGIQPRPTVFSLGGPASYSESGSGGAGASGVGTSPAAYAASSAGGAGASGTATPSGSFGVAVANGGVRASGVSTVASDAATLDTSLVADVRRTVEGDDLRISWSSTAPAGSWFQVYVNGRLAEVTRSRRAIIPFPPSRATIVVGAVAAGRHNRDYSAQLPADVPKRRASLTWSGGTYLSEEIAGFNVYGSPSPGAPIDYARPIETVSAYGGGDIDDGFGRGGFGLGGFGRAATQYGWESEPLARGVWRFGVKSVDRVGNEGDAWESAVTVVGPPPPPPRDPDGVRVRYGYDAATRVATLSWLPAED